MQTTQTYGWDTTSLTLQIQLLQANIYPRIYHAKILYQYFYNLCVMSVLEEEKMTISRIPVTQFHEFHVVANIRVGSH